MSGGFGLRQPCPIRCGFCEKTWTATREQAEDPNFVSATMTELAAHYREEHGDEDFALKIERFTIWRGGLRQRQGW